MRPLDMATCIDVLADESARALSALQQADPQDPVPSAPGWTADDLAWHLGEVQWFWASVVAEGVTDPGALTRPPRPQGEAVLAFLVEQSAALEASLRGRDPGEPCYSWFEEGRSVGWVARRQAHEALIHRVDAQLVAGLPVTDPSPEVADDGISELAQVVLHLPAWGTFTRDGTSVRLDATDTGEVWTLVLGRFTGTSPTTGEAVDADAARLAAGAGEGPAQVTTLISGTSWDMDRWLWGRGPLDPLLVEGDPDLPARLRALATVE